MNLTCPNKCESSFEVTITVDEYGELSEEINHIPLEYFRCLKCGQHL